MAACHAQALTAVSSLLPGGAGAAADAGRHTQQALELAAQLQYRLGRSKECIQLYDTLFQQHKVSKGGACVHGAICGSSRRVGQQLRVGKAVCVVMLVCVHPAALSLSLWEACGHSQQPRRAACACASSLAQRRPGMLKGDQACSEKARRV